MLRDHATKWERFGAKYECAKTGKTAKMGRWDGYKSNIWAKAHISSQPGGEKG